jgi:hypothetical protein
VTGAASQKKSNEGTETGMQGESVKEMESKVKLIEKGDGVKPRISNARGYDN